MGLEGKCWEGTITIEKRKCRGGGGGGGGRGGKKEVVVVGKLNAVRQGFWD